MKLTDRIGAILVIAAKPRIQSSVRSALTAKYGRVLTAETVQEARRAVEREKIALMVIFSPLKDEEEIPRLFDMADRRGIAAGYIVKFLKKITEKFPRSLDGIRPILIYPLGGILIIGVVMCAINPLMGAINTGLSNMLNAMGSTSKVLLGLVLGGMMSIDMGGPVNKAAYVFGTAALSNGNYDIMAAVMVGGMVPPLVIALSTTFFPKKWTKEERNNGFVNYIMGLCFISEGAIPYAAADPGRVLPSCIIGSAIAGALSMIFGCTLMAPHGGIFVFPTVGKPLMYIVALLVGSVVGALVLTALKKNKEK